MMSEKQPLISVIVPIYKVEQYLNRCVQSIVDQTYKNLEIILVDDGSPDNSPAMCDAWAEKDDRVQVVHKKNGGVSSARNAGLDAANGAYIGFVDGDDYIEPDMYAQLLQAIQKIPVTWQFAGITITKMQLLFRRAFVFRQSRQCVICSIALQMLLKVTVGTNCIASR